MTEPHVLAESPEILARRFRELFDRISASIGRRVVGQKAAVASVFSALLAGGHVLLEGVPGLGKTLLVRTLAESLSLAYGRIQFTPDLMPADVTGTHLVVEEPDGRRSFRFQRGPVFAQIVLADEINRATPKTQSALLEAMEERAVTSGGRRYELDEPFCVLATQNPIEMEGTYPLPEAQLDRFLFKVKIPYPSLEDLKEIGRRTTSAEPAPTGPVAGAEEILALRRLVRSVAVAPHIEDYVARLVVATNPGPRGVLDEVRRFVRCGASPRGLQALLLGGKVRALLAGRFHLSAEDARAVALEALRHRLVLSFEGEAEGVDPDGIVRAVVESVKGP
ncbi:MAG: AAA family ATPase [Planctomycetes bacterium]|nr:AAA family ATPase [Planctomycetota bacterium]